MLFKIIDIKEKDDSFYIETEKTILRTAGGGQPADHGKILTLDKEYAILDCIKEDGKIWHVIKDSELSVGDEVELIIDGFRREVLSRMHTGEHLLFKALSKKVNDLELDKIALDVDESKLFVKSSMVTWDDLIESEKICAKLIDDGIELEIKEVDKEKVQEFEDLRIKTDRIKEDTVRVVEVPGYDVSACCGSHCANTRDVGDLYITHFRSDGDGRWEIRFTVHEGMLHEHATLARKAISLMGTDSETFLKAIENMKNDFEKYKKVAREHEKEAAKNLATILDPIDVKGNLLYYCEFDEIEKKAFSEAMDGLKDKNEIVILINAAKNQISVYVPETKPFDAPKLLNAVLDKTEGRGGGKGMTATGGFDTKYLNEIKTIVLSVLESMLG